MLLFFPITLIASLLAGGSLRLQGSEQEPAFLVMSFNIRYGTADDGENSWRFRKELVSSLIADHDPDLIGLQEALRFQIDEIRQASPVYGEVGVGRNDGKTAGEYCSILYRKGRFDLKSEGTFWYSDTPDVPGSIGWGNSITRICTWARLFDRITEREFYLFNTHLDHRSQLSRERSVLYLSKRIHSREHPEPVILTGDLNAGEDNPAIRYLLGKDPLIKINPGGEPNPVPLIDSFRIARPGAEEVGTFNSFRGISDGEKIDFVFTTDSFEIIDADIVRTHFEGHYPSDHFPVIARLRLRSLAGDRTGREEK
jgi:endonuclease/exonuclease/phosphatase family metal-dependent hydrolase